jgi:hypothetical protein
MTLSIPYLPTLAIAAGLALAMPSFVVAETATMPARTFTPQQVSNALQPLVPSGVSISEVRVERNTVVVTGTSPSNTVLSQFLRNTTETAEFERVELRSIEQQGSASRYEMSLEIDCSAQPAAKPGSLCGAPAKAQSVYKCRIDGTMTFQATPCPPGSEGS